VIANLLLGWLALSVVVTALLCTAMLVGRRGSASPARSVLAQRAAHARRTTPRSRRAA
jgi:hypothetical protein